MVESRLLFKKALKYLQEKNIESPRSSCELIFSATLNVDRLSLYILPSLLIEAEVADLLWKRIERRATGEPLDYILGFSPFYGGKILVSPAVLIPRPETEYVVEAALNLLPRISGSILDVGTGSGAIVVTLAKLFPDRSFYGSDISEEALEVARKNGKNLPNLCFYKDDLLNNPPLDFFELIVANLPYIPSEILPRLSPEIQFEPAIALDGGKEGLELIKKFIRQAKKRCRYCILEIGDGQFSKVSQFLQEQGFSIIEVKKDLSQMERVIVGRNCGEIHY
ncbi:peptide chain release factor N(5)-glutamine methyltransferase [Candidatus Methylacidiphilum infernorum]|uniref:Release factor glutamine methyltransferase n=1 Tax=Candidatus Methylacidiphilum infernorum TaxID=511746 RepID=A0ABX7PTK7_9BACT|nr:peptide chain release factor N(5)-glutamine methyltransferase [Candidatus Methylacidiphilum infernorum]QSR86315.1 peptide chain release factor N(5)-glutamine methyltransferase [Candidatus Methylacidiphilum infernorum]